VFQAEPVLWLQGFASPALTWLMGSVTLLGYAPVYAALILFLAFAVRLRPALGVLLAVLLAAAATDALKDGVGFPRPSHADERVIEPRGTARVALVPRGAATTFWSLPTSQARAAIRAVPGASYGFPSGHVSSAAAFCLALAALFRWRGTLALAIGWPILMGLSRMYLGRHFLGDALGGLVVGMLAAAGAILLLRWCGAIGESPRPRRIGVVAGVTAALAALALWWPVLPAENVGRLAGLVLALAVFNRAGFPADEDTWSRRAARFAAAALLYGAVSLGLGWVLEATAWEDRRLPTLIAAALTVAVTFLGGAYLGRRTRSTVAA
jgi:membrane-associated phospholipid phosphatase